MCIRVFIHDARYKSRLPFRIAEIPWRTYRAFFAAPSTFSVPHSDPVAMAWLAVFIAAIHTYFIWIVAIRVIRLVHISSYRFRPAIPVQSFFLLVAWSYPHALPLARCGIAGKAGLSANWMRVDSCLDLRGYDAPGRVGCHIGNMAWMLPCPCGRILI